MSHFIGEPQQMFSPRTAPCNFLQYHDENLLVALAIGNRRVLRRFAHALPWLKRATGMMLILLAAGMLTRLAWG